MTNFCKFNGHFYKFSDGLPMDSPLAPLVADVFMDKLETELFASNHTLTKYTQYWYRYVDDILCLWNGTTSQLHEFRSLLNSLYPSIKFTLEIGGNQINFLDLEIPVLDGKHSFGIYRKPTTTDVLICGDSYHPFPHKNAAIHNMIHRLLYVPLLPTAITEKYPSSPTSLPLIIFILTYPN